MLFWRVEKKFPASCCRLPGAGLTTLTGILPALDERVRVYQGSECLLRGYMMTLTSEHFYTWEKRQ